VCFVLPLGAGRLTATAAYVAEIGLVVEQAVGVLFDTTGLAKEQAAGGPGRSPGKSNKEEPVDPRLLRRQIYAPTKIAANSSDGLASSHLYK
jgi:hypothetical protein